MGVFFLRLDDNKRARNKFEVASFGARRVAVVAVVAVVVGLPVVGGVFPFRWRLGKCETVVWVLEFFWAVLVVAAVLIFFFLFNGAAVLV